MRRIAVGIMAALLLVSMMSAATARKGTAVQTITVYEPVNGKDYDLTIQGNAVKVDQLGEVGLHQHFRVRVFRVGVTDPVINTISAYRDDLDREAIGTSFPVEAGGYYWTTSSPQGQTSYTVQGVFVVTDSTP